MLTVEATHATPSLYSRLVLTYLCFTGILSVPPGYCLRERMLTNQALVRPSERVFYLVSSWTNILTTKFAFGVIALNLLQIIPPVYIWTLIYPIFLKWNKAALVSEWAAVKCVMHWSRLPRESGVSLAGDTQEPSGLNSMPCVLGLTLQGGWSKGPTVVPSSLTHPLLLYHLET